MKKLFVGVILMVLLSGCSLIGEVNQSLEYVNEATDHINYLSSFAEEAPQMIQDAATSPAVKEELIGQLNELKTEIEAFNLLDAPTIAQDFHDMVVEKHEELLVEINNVVKDGQLTIEQLENSAIFQTINEITKLKNQIENLGL